MHWSNPIPDNAAGMQKGPWCLSWAEELQAISLPALHSYSLYHYYVFLAALYDVYCFAPLFSVVEYSIYIYHVVCEFKRLLNLFIYTLCNIFICFSWLMLESDQVWFMEIYFYQSVMLRYSRSIIVLRIKIKTFNNGDTCNIRKVVC